MKLKMSVLTAGLLCGVLLCGCYVEEEQVTTSDDPLLMEERPVIDLYNDLAIQNAIITQRTIYPYHFDNNSATLNTLGQRDMAVLANHFVQNPGELAVRRGDAAQDLYRKRVETVMARLAESGVEQGRIRVGDGMPGGDGMSTTDMIEVLERSREPFSDDSGYSTGVTTHP